MHSACLLLAAGLHTLSTPVLQPHAHVRERGGDVHVFLRPRRRMQQHQRALLPRLHAAEGRQPAMLSYATTPGCDPPPAG